jgi:hypothetical protein
MDPLYVVHEWVCLAIGLCIAPPACYQVVLDIQRAKANKARSQGSTTITPTRRDDFAVSVMTKFHVAIFLSSICTAISGIDPFGFRGRFAFETAGVISLIASTCLVFCLLVLAQQITVAVSHISMYNQGATLPRLLFICWRLSEVLFVISMIWITLFGYNIVHLDQSTANVLGYLGYVWGAVALWTLCFPSIWGLIRVYKEILLVEQLKDDASDAFRKSKRRILLACTLFGGGILMIVYYLVPKGTTEFQACDSGCPTARDNYQSSKLATLFVRGSFLLGLLLRVR